MNSRPFGSGLPLVIDTSAWNRQNRDPHRERWKTTARAGQLVACPVSTLEILAGTRDQREFAAFDAALRALPQAPINSSVCQAALLAANELKGSRRLPVADYLIAAAAAERGFGVLHADRHFDLLATVLPFESVRLPE
ncbi:MAG TPA: PIN domain-containing protein [Solirubrobacterales bacterium]|jgi:predicted nucleic acid-binding protein|nr:PIN domain-containing protein [Solirubrobacterales bacterium]